jgi:hypothetical protein
VNPAASATRVITAAVPHLRDLTARDLTTGDLTTRDLTTRDI